MGDTQMKCGSDRWIRRAARAFGPYWSLLALAIVLVASAPANAQTKWDYTKVVGPEKCAECHKPTVAIWKNTHHYTTFTELPRRKEANEIAQKMGLKRIKAGSLCLDCHFTTVVKDGKREAVAGISCESCHGPAAGYLKRHSEFSGKKKGTETEAEKKQRWADSEAAGMIRPKNIYAWAKNCYNCHVVPQEKLVNVGGHTAGSAFELVTWSQGEIRHNVWYTEGKSNPLASPEQRRVMFLVGLGVELETALRAVGEATQKDKYAVAMAQRAKRGELIFAKLAQTISLPEIDDILAAAKTAKLKLNNKAELNATADKVAEATKSIATKYDGSKLAALDALIPGKDKYKGTPKQ